MFSKKKGHAFGTSAEYDKTLVSGRRRHAPLSTLYVTVVEAQGLEHKGKNNERNVYTTLSLQPGDGSQAAAGQAFKTETMFHTKEPKWLGR